MVAFLSLVCYADIKVFVKGEKRVAKRVVIAGSRTFCDYEVARCFIDRCIAGRDGEEIIVLSGCARGADALGERYAHEHGLTIELYPAQWQTYGKAAGIRRNQEMAEACDLVICFWDGGSRGTKSMIALARKYNKPVFIKEIERLGEQ